MGILKKLIGTRNKVNVGPEKESKKFLDDLNMVIGEAKKLVSSAPKINNIVENEAVNIVDGFFYSNLINNFRNNLNDENLEEYNIPKEDVEKIQQNFKDIFDKVDENLKKISTKNNADSKLYQNFKERLPKITKDGYRFLVEIEKLIDIDSCEEIIAQFKKDVKSLGKKFKSFEDGSFGFEGGDDDVGDYSSNEITDFNNITMELKDTPFGDGKSIYKGVYLDDGKGSFSGQYHQSNNKKYVVAYTDMHIEVDGKGKEKKVLGQVYLIENKKILWKKKIGRPNAGFVTNEGKVAIIDWISYTKKLGGKLYFFDRQGTKVFEQEFNSNISGQDASNDGGEIILTTAFPENSIYLFSLNENELVRKINNTTSQRPLSRFDFDEVKGLVLKEKSYVQPKRYQVARDKLSSSEELVKKGYPYKQWRLTKRIDYFKK